MSRIVVTNGKIVTPTSVECKKVLLIEGGRILDVCDKKRNLSHNCKIIDAQGAYVIPGLVDIHCDALEFRLFPRPNVSIPYFFAFSYYEKELLSSGITTQFHGVYWGDVLEKHRSVAIALEMIDKILAYRRMAVLTHKIFIRFDIVNGEAKDNLLSLIKKGLVDLLSFQYHLPGQAQFKDIETFRNYYTKVRGWTEKELERFMRTYCIFSLKDRYSLLSEIAESAKELSVPLVSHDDDSKEKIQVMKRLEVGISEFPVNLESAIEARENGMDVVVGAPNVVRGISSCGNVSARLLIKKQAANIICSDYHPPSMLYAAGVLYREEGFSLHEAINMVTLNPAIAVGLGDKGAILPGKIADIVIFDFKDEFPEVKAVLIKGRDVYRYGSEEQ